MSEIRTKPQKYIGIRKAGYQHTLKKHSSKAIAEYFLKIIEEYEENRFWGTEQVISGIGQWALTKVKHLFSEITRFWILSKVSGYEKFEIYTFLSLY